MSGRESEKWILYKRKAMRCWEIHLGLGCGGGSDEKEREALTERMLSSREDNFRSEIEKVAL